MNAPATEVHETLVVMPGTSLPGMRINWGGVWSGFLVAAGILLLLAVLGLAVGVSAAIDIGSGGGFDPRGFGVAAAAWSAVSLLIALFVGGMVATRGSMVHGGAAGLIEGTLVWVLAIFALAVIAGSNAGMIDGGVIGTLGAGRSGMHLVVATPVDVSQRVDALSVALWSVLLALVASLLAAVAGALTGRRLVVRRLDDAIDHRDRR